MSSHQSRAAENDCTDLDGITPGGSFRVAEQRSGARRLVGSQRRMEFAECRLRGNGRRTQRDFGGGAGRGVARAQCRAVRGRACALFGVADAGQRQQRSGSCPARDRGHRLHHGVGRDADLAGAGRQPRHPCAYWWRRTSSASTPFPSRSTRPTTRGCGSRRPPRWPPIKRSPPRRWRQRRKPIRRRSS